MVRNYQLFGKGSKPHEIMIRLGGLSILVVALIYLSSLPRGYGLSAMAFFFVPPAVFYPLAKITQQKKLTEMIATGIKRQTSCSAIVIGYVFLCATSVFGEIIFSRGIWAPSMF